METAKLVYKSEIILSRVWDMMYKPMGWRFSKPMYKKWSWGMFCFVYVLEAYRDEPATTREVINNRSDKNTAKHTFSYTANDMSIFMKEFWCDPNTFNPVIEFNKWQSEIKLKHDTK